MKNLNERAHYRIPYSSSERPYMWVDGEICELVDCSEGGLRYRPAGPEMPVLGASVSGKIFFRSGERVEVSGMVVRLQDGEVALQLTEQGIPYMVIIAEQHFLRGGAGPGERAETT